MFSAFRPGPVLPIRRLSSKETDGSDGGMVPDEK